VTAKHSVYDVIPTRDLQRISILQEQAVELENQAFVLQAKAQDLRVKADDIVTVYRVRVEKNGWDACRTEALEQNMHSWKYDPLPGQGVRA